ncbi:hypothetical protein KSP39_PZI021773 [Platanthera zijinensis]|uniref:Reverse transcriptase Ty1/copia-type domain-containing protein n=1 Tax=Platanthera zijinensis TaxID=2320716 RepID=A0AAP0AWW3_9ASPA
METYIEEEIYVSQPQGYILEGEEKKVLKLKKALYGLKQTPRAWYHKIDSELQIMGFTKTQSESGMYVRKKEEGGTIIVCIYVDDLLIIVSNPLVVNKFKTYIATKFEITDLGIARYFLGIEILQSPLSMLISQHRYAKDILYRFRMQESKPAKSPMITRDKIIKEDGEEKANPE